MRTKTLKIFFNLIPEIESLENLDKTISNFQEMVYHLQIIQEDFDWANWEEGKQILQNSNKGFDKCNIDTLCKLITAIVRNDKFNENYLESKFTDGTILKIIKAMENKTKKYDIDEHTHRFAVWTAARAAQRGFKSGTVDNFRIAIENIDLKKSLQEQANKKLTPTLFDDWHKKNATLLKDEIKKITSTECKYSRAAKIIAIYIKTTYVIKDSKSDISKFAHPPIDSILLKEICRHINENNLRDASIQLYRKFRWTKEDESEYFQLINNLSKDFRLEYFWEIENFWQPTEDKSKK